MKMTDLSDIQLSQIAKLYYKDGRPQHEIAAYLGLSKMTVSRMLQKARGSDIVQISIKPPFEIVHTLSNEITKKYRIRKTIVVKTKSLTDQNLQRTIGRAAAFYVINERLDHQIIGMGVGHTIGQLVQQLIPINPENLHIVQLMGGLSNVTAGNPLTILHETCKRLGAKGTYLTSFAIVENKEQQKNLLYNTPMGTEVLGLWEKCSKAFFGIGSIESGTILSRDLVSPQELELLKGQKIIGDILGHCFNEEGVFIETELEEKLVSIPIKFLENIVDRIGVAGGEIKAKAIRAALISGIITTLITDETAAAALLK